MSEDETAKALAHAHRQLEALERRLQVEEALDRVRARALSMRRSDELASVAAVMLREEQALGIESLRSGIGIVAEDETKADVWTASTTADGEDDLQLTFYIPLQGHPAVAGLHAAWKRQDNWYLLDLSGDDLAGYVQFMKERLAGPFPQDPVFDPWAMRRVVFHFFPFPEGAVSAITVAPLPEAVLHELRRLADAFSFAYTRYLDLKHAEAQAREAQIEAALERVRSRSMGMHQSTELADVAGVVFEQLDGLRLGPAYASISIIKEAAGYADLWLTAFGGDVNPIGIQVPLTGHPQVEKNIADWKRGDPFVAWVVEGKEAVRAQAETYAALTGDPLFLSGAPAERQEHLEACHTYGLVGIVSYEPISAETPTILQRFARVFEMTYRRFLDLKQAEEQAREAQVEAALERVRAQAMAMHSSEDLASTITTFFRELRALNITPIRCGVGLIDGETRLCQLLTSTTTAQGDALELGGTMKLEGHPAMEGIFEHWKRQQEYHHVLEGEDLKRYYQLLEPNLAVPTWQNDIVQHGYFFYFPEGGLYAWTEAAFTEDELRVFRKFSSVLGLTYRRFLDLQQAEARAREAVREASLDRVRAEIATMRTADDLGRITPLIWRELTTLGVSFIRCGVFIINEAREEVEIFQSNHYGKQIATLRLPFDSHAVIQNAVAAWRNRQVFTDRWSQAFLLAWVRFLMERGDVANAEDYLDGAGPPPSLALHFVPFAQGLLYVGSTESLSDDQVDLVQALADAFAVAYARYEDFKRLEAAKADVEATLEHLKTTQAQLIQAEKMASLGQLTAGIAHEIKNPLNFVNNFAQLSIELADELEDEIATHQDKPVAEIREDLAEILGHLKHNASKIHEHGKRADGIVRSMLDHARPATGQREPTDVNALVEEYLNLCYHGLCAHQDDFGVTFERDYDPAAGTVTMVPQEIGRVLFNLLHNAFYAVEEKRDTAAASYTPLISVGTRRAKGHVEIWVRDNGSGIPDEARAQIFEPFFTTKPTGTGTGLGLSLSHDIVTQGHGGTMAVESIEGAGAAFVMMLPV